MKQILQNLKNGKTEIVEVPCPAVKAGHLLIQTTCSLVSLGTERMLVEFGHANLIQKTRQQPEKIKQVLDKVRSDGLLPQLRKLGGVRLKGICTTTGTNAAEIGGQKTERSEDGSVK